MSSRAPSITAHTPARNARRNNRQKPSASAASARGAFHRIVRKTHLWVAVIVALPLLLRLVTGITLQVRKPVDFIQPTTEVGVSKYDPAVTHAQILAAVKEVPEMRVRSWDDIKAIDYRPKKNIIKVRNHTEFESQIDAKTGVIVKSGRRWNDTIARWHDGSEWGMRLWLFFPLALLIVYLWISGLYLAIVETVRKIPTGRRQSDPPLKPHGATTSAPKRGRRFNLAAFCLRYHYWLAVIVIFPWMLVTVSGLALQLRYELPGIDPGLQRGTQTVPTLSYAQVLDIAATTPGFDVRQWKDVWRVYTHPGQGVIAVRTKRGLRAQFDAATGEVLTVAEFTRDFWEDLHQGIIGRHELPSGRPFGDLEVDLRFWLFLPIHFVTLLLWLTGLIYFLRTKIFKRRVHRNRFESQAADYDDLGVDGSYQTSSGSD